MSRVAYSLLPTLIVVVVLTVHTAHMTHKVSFPEPLPPDSENLSSELVRLHASVDQVLQRLDALHAAAPAPAAQVMPPDADADAQAGTQRQAKAGSDDGGEEDIPDLFIYRRTKKTGSSSMLTALLDQLVPRFNYVPLYLVADEMSTIVHHEYRRKSPRRLFIAQHNGVCRDIHPQRRAIVADTFRSGYDQMTSYCRFVKDIGSCDDQAMLDCLARTDSRAQRQYRWAGRDKEDQDTYIDLPLSSAHPALSTTVLRSFFGSNVTLNIRSYNVYNSSCPELPTVRAVYSQYYELLDKDVNMLARRLLILAGYTITVQPDLAESVSIDDLLQAAEEMEHKKYDVELNGGAHVATKRLSDFHKQLNSDMKKWVRDVDGNLALQKRF